MSWKYLGIIPIVIIIGASLYIWSISDNLSRVPAFQHLYPNFTKTYSPQTEYIYLAAYYRSGSTLIGELFNRNPDVFYWFEPLAGIQEKLANSYTHVYENGSMRKIDSSTLSQMVATLEDIFTCRLEHLSKSILRHRFVTTDTWDKSLKVRMFRLCIKLENADVCLKRLQEACRRAKYKVIKDIRLPISETERLLKKHKKLKIIYQTRDPRGQLLSLWPATSTKPRLPIDARYVCRHVIDDFRSYERLRITYPDAILWVRYEDMAVDPTGQLKRIYKFAGISMTHSLETWLWRTTHATSNGNAISTSRKNATKTAYRWREQLATSQIEKINEECGDLIRLLRYTL